MDSADGETRGGREGGEDGSEPPDEAEYPDAGYNDMTDPPNRLTPMPQQPKRCSATFMPSTKGLDDNHRAHLHHASHIPT